MTKIRLVHDSLFLSVKQMLRISTQVFKRSSCLHQYLVFFVFFTRYASILIVGQPNRKANSTSWLMMIKRIRLSHQANGKGDPLLLALPIKKWDVGLSPVPGRVLAIIWQQVPGLLAYCLSLRVAHSSHYLKTTDNLHLVKQTKNFELFSSLKALDSLSAQAVLIFLLFNRCLNFHMFILSDIMFAKQIQQTKKRLLFG